jgi:DNA gyrase subunit A
VVSEKGYGKRSDIEEYRVTNRGGKGVKTINITEKTGNLIGIKSVTDANDLMIITKNGITIRLKVNTLRVMGRATQGVRLINISESDEIAAVTKVDRFEDEIENDSTIETENTDNLNSENNSQENNSDTTTNETNE